jgi:hypothetical protein
MVKQYGLLLRKVISVKINSIYRNNLRAISFAHFVFPFNVPPRTGGGFPVIT